MADCKDKCTQKFDFIEQRMYLKGKGEFVGWILTSDNASLESLSTRYFHKFLLSHVL